MPIVNPADIAAHATLTTGIHGAGSKHIALFDVASTVVNRIVWKNASENALTDGYRSTDSGWTGLDLTAYTSVKAKFAILRLRNYVNLITAGARCSFLVRKNGTTPDAYPGLRVSTAKGDTEGVEKLPSVIVGLDAGQVMEWRVYVTGTIQISSYIDVLGYIE